MAEAAAVSETKGRVLLSRRSRGFCEVQHPGYCAGIAETAHHRRKRSAGGSWDPANLLAVCGHGTAGCHGWIEANPMTAAAQGLWLRNGQPLGQEVWMVFRGVRAWWQLHPDGTITWLRDED